MRGRGNPDEKRIRSYLRGARRGEVVGRVDPGDELENTRDHERLWAAMSHTRRKAARALAAAGSATVHVDDYASLASIPLEFASQIGTHNGSRLGGIDGGTAYDYEVDPIVSNGGKLIGAVNGDRFLFPFPFAPAGSLWAFSVRGRKGPSFGNLQISLANLESPNPNRAGTDDEGTFNDYEPDLTFVDVPDAFVNCYSVTDTGDFEIIGRAAFRLTGDPGDPLTAFSGSDGYTGVDLCDGGPGWYMVRVQTDGKNGSSSAYDMEISALVIARLVG